tara:strand:+ start:123 stop:266 length:144 start_codon:yes stop_codon:yes gene_type:complete
MKAKDGEERLHAGLGAVDVTVRSTTGGQLGDRGGDIRAGRGVVGLLP